MFKSKRSVSLIISGILTFQILTSIVLKPIGVGNVEAATNQNSTTVSESVYGTLHNTTIPILPATPLPTPLPTTLLETTSTPSPTPMDVESPTVPLNVSCLEKTDTTISLSWSESIDNVDVKGYKIYRNEIEVGDTETTNFLDNGLYAKTTYNYYIKAYDATGNISDKSLTISIFTLANDITNVEATQNTETAITISWNQVANAVKYEICADGVNSYNVANTYTHTGLIKNTIHTYKVRAILPKGVTSAWSEILTIYTAPEKPLDVSADIHSGSIVEIRWEEVPDASKYKVLRIGKTEPVVVTGLSYEDAGLSLGTDYIYEVTALDENEVEMGNSGRVLVNTGEVTITKKSVFFENRVYGSLIFKIGSSNTLDVNGYKMTVEGNCILKSGDIRLKKGNLMVSGDLTQSRGNIYVEEGKVLIKGNFTQTGGRIYMVSEEDYVCVEGNFLISTDSHDNNWIAGVLEVKGNFTQRNYSSTSSSNFLSKGSHKTILSGLNEQVVSFSDKTSSKFNILEVIGANSSVKFESPMQMSTFICERPINSNLELKAIVNPLENDLIINGDLIISGRSVNLNANGHRIKIEGNLIHSNGNIYVGKGEILIKGNFNETGGKMYMVDDTDYVCIEGDFFISTDSHDNNWIAGVLEVKGNFSIKSRNSFISMGSHKTILSGLNEQVVSFSTSTNSKFNILYISGIDGFVRFESPIMVNTFICERTINSNLEFRGIVNPIEGNITVNGDLIIVGDSNFDINGYNVLVKGNMKLYGKTININNGEFLIEGNVFQTGGEIHVSKGKFLISGDYSISNSSGKLYMLHNEDYVLVEGNFKFQANKSDSFQAGLLEVKGNFTQRDYTYGISNPWNMYPYHIRNNFIPSGTHRVLLSGDKTQVIDFESPAIKPEITDYPSRFNILITNKPIEYGFVIVSKDKPTNARPWISLQEIYHNDNPPPGTFITKPKLTPAREGLAMAEVNGRIYAFGGKTENGEYLNTVSEYDYIADEWTEDTSDPNNLMQTGKSDFAIAATDNDIYIFGGFDGENYLSTVERYNPADGKFILRDSIPPMPTARSGAKAVLIDEKIYVIGGINEKGYLNTIEVYDTKNNTWTTINDNTNIPRTDFGMVSYGEKIYIFGGCNDDGIIDIVEEYDTNTGNCTEKTPLPIKTKGLQACNVDGKIYLFCGTTFDGTTTKVTNIVDRYDPQTHTYLSVEADKDPNDNIVKLRSLQYARTSFGAVAAFGRVFIAAGNDGTKCLSVAGEYVVNQIKGTIFGDDYNGTEGRGTRYDSTGANVLTGNYLTQSIDISIDSPAMNVEAVRSYNSNDSDTQDSLVIGNGWRMSFESFIKNVDTNTYKVKASTLNLRRIPTDESYPTENDPICGLANGTILRHTGRVFTWSGHSDWFEVITPNNQTGLVSSYYLTKVQGVEVTYPTGSKIVFTADGANYKAPVGCYDELIKISVDGTSMYKLKKKDQTAYLYYANTGKLAYQEDRYGNRIKFQYDTEGRLDKIFDCDSSDAEIGRTLKLKYSSGKLESISDGAGRIVSYNYTDGKLSSVTNLNEKVTKYDYYTEGEGAKNKIKTVKKTNDENKEITLYTNFYDELGRLIKQVDSNNKAAYYMYTDLSADDTSEMTTNGLEICRQYYNRKGDLTKEIYNINFPDRPIRVIDGIGKETTTQYYLLSGNDYVETTNFTDQMLRSETNRKLWETNLSQKIVTAEVVKADNTTTQVNRTIIEMDDKQNVTLVKNPDNTEKRYKYNKSNDLEYVIDEMNYQTYYHYEDARLKNVIKTLTPVDSNSLIDNITNVDVLDKNKNAITTYDYENKKILSLVKKVTYPNGTYTENEYYDQGMIKSTSNGVNTTEYSYDNCFRVESVTTDLLNQTIYEYDNMNNVTKITKQDKDENSSITRMFYDYDGRKTQEINPLIYNSTYDKGSSYSGEISDQYSYDPYGRVLNHTQNVRNTDSTIKDYSYIYTYDGEGNLETEIKPSKAKYIYNYDGLGRLTAVYFNSIPLEEYKYNEYIKLDDGTYGTEKVHTKYLSSYKDGNNTNYITSDTKYLMDYAGRTIKIINPTEGDVEEFSKTEYYKDGKVRKVTDPRNNSTLYTYNNYDNTNLGMVYDEKFVPVTEENGNIKYSYSKITYDLSGRKVFETAYVDLVEITEETDGKITIKAGSPQSKYNEIHYEYYSNNKVMRISSYGVDTTKIPAKSTMAKITEYKYDKDGNVTEEKIKFDSGKQTINVYLDYNMYGKPQKTAVLISNADLEKDLHDIEGENIVAYNDLFTDATRNENYGYSSDYEDYSSIVTSYSDFDKAGNVGVVTSPSGQTVNYYYDSLGRVGKQTIPDTEVVDVDGAGNQTSVETITTYNWEGKVADIKVYASNRLLKNEQYQYNSRGLLEKTIQKGITTKKFDRVTNTETVTTQDLTTAYEYDIAGRLVAEVTPENYVGYINGEGLLSKDTVNRTEYLYDKQGRLISKAYRGKIKEYNESNGDFTEDTRYIVIEAYKYDANGNVLKKVDGEAYNKVYDSTVAVEDLINSAYGVEYSYNLANQLETIKNPEFTGATGRNYNQKYAYDGLGRKVNEVTAHGVNKTLNIKDQAAPKQVSSLYYSNTRYLYDDVNRKLDVWVKDNVDNPTSKEYTLMTEYYDYAGSNKNSVDANGKLTSYEYNSFGAQRTIIYSGDVSIPENIVKNKYDTVGNLKYQIDSVGNVKEYDYDLFGRVINEKNYGTKGDNSCETENRYLYDLYGNVKYQIDANNTVTKNEYDELGRLTRSVIDNVTVVDPATGLDSTTRTSTHETLKYYDKNGNVINEVLKVTENDTLNNTTRSSYSVNTYEYDRMGRLIRKTDPAGNAVEKINYNYNSAQIESYDGEDHLKTFEYNKDGKVSVTKQRLEAGEYRKTEQFYDANGNVSTVIDGKGNQTVYTYNEQNKLTEVSSYEKVGEGLYNSTDTTRYTYYNNGNMKSQEINGIITNTLHYNARNLVKEKEYLGTSNNIVSYNYYADGTVSDVTDRENIKTQYLYNPQGLVLEENAVDGKDQSFTKKSFEYDNAGNQLKSTITSSTTAPEVIERTYDELGRVKTKAVSNIEGKVIYVYDIVTSEGLTAETAIDQKNNTTTKVYDTTGRLAFVKKGDIEAENAAQYIYYGNGAAQSVIYAGGAREDYEYYEDGLLKSLINTKNDGSELESFVYTYDENGNMLSKLDNKGITEYTYDNLNRLKTVDEHYSGKNTEYAYDKLGNRTTEIIKESGIIKEHIYSYNYDLNQLDKVTVKIGGTVNSTTDYGYDANGNQISSVTDGKTITYAYDEFNQLISTNGAGYGYNAEGYRISKKVDGSLTKYLYEFDKVVLEVESKTGQADKVNRNIYGTNLLMRTADGQSYYYMYNGHADVTALINVATDNVDATYYYDAFGNIDPTGTTGDVNNNITYAGYQYDEETGLYYLNARMYDPKIARFLQEDTYGGSASDPLSLNLYTYCANNPLVYYDPTGNTYVPLEVPTQYVNKHYNSVKAYDLAWRKQTDKDFAKRVELGEIIDRKMRSDKSAENIVLGSSQLEHEAMLFLQDQVYVHGQQALEVTVERLLENKRLYLKTGDKIYLTLFKNAYVDYVASKNTYSELGFEIKNGFVKDENYYETLYNIYYREDNFKEWLLLERNLQTLFAEAQAHINAGIQLGSMGVLQNMASSYTNVNNNLNSLDIKNSRLDKMEYNAYTGNVNKPTNSVPQTSFKYKLNKDFRGIFKLKETGNLDAGVGKGGLTNTAEEVVTYRRVQGGTPPNASWNRIQVEDGKIVIPNKKSNLNISTGNADHANYFLQKRGSNAEIVEFDVPKWLDDFINESAIPQKNYNKNPLNQGGTAPKIVDPTTPGDSYELPAPWIEWIEEYATNGRVIPNK